MARPRPWTVLPHGPLERLEDNLWAVTGTMPHGPMNRRMAIIRLAGGALLFHNAIPLDEAAMSEVAALGTPAILVVPNRRHRLDVFAFQQRLGLRVLCPAPARRYVEERVAVDAGLDALPRDAALEAVPLDGSREGEAALLVRSAGGARASLVFGDTVMNVPHVAGLAGTILRVAGTSGGPRVTRIGRLLAVRDRAALAAHLARLAATRGLARLVVSHGVDVTADAPEVLRRVATALAT